MVEWERQVGRSTKCETCPKLHAEGDTLCADCRAKYNDALAKALEKEEKRR
jgi:hypothetical protein